MMTNRAKHPGVTGAQRRVLNEIGCGNNSPYMTPKVRDALLESGTIVEIEPRRVFGPGNSIIDRIPREIRRFEMPTAIHIQWCEAFSPEDK